MRELMEAGWIEAPHGSYRNYGLIRRDGETITTIHPRTVEALRSRGLIVVERLSVNPLVLQMIRKEGPR